MQRIKTLLKKLLLLVLTGGICVFILEFGIRAFLPFYHPGTQIDFTLDANGMALGPANQTRRLRQPKGDYDLDVSFNRHGLRDTKDLKDCGPGDLIALGDSFTMGWGIPETNRFSSRLEAALARPVFNVAIPGDVAGGARLLAHAQTNGARARTIIFGLCMENDLKNYEKPAPPPPPTAANLRSKRGVQDLLKRHSALYFFLSYELNTIPATRKLFEQLGLARNIDQLTHRNDDDPAALESTARKVAELLAPYPGSVVLIIPSRANWSGDHRATESAIHEKVTGLLRTNGVQIVDMKPVIEAAGTPLNFYFTTDAHWNSEGHRLAAETLANHFTNRATTLPSPITH